MKNKFYFFIKNNLSFIILSLTITAVAAINSLNHIGLIEDGVHHFWEVLISSNIWTGHEGFAHFPYNSRFFPSILSHLGTGLAIKAGVTNISVLLYIFTFISYLSPLIFLAFVYLNLPKDKKNIFDLILLSFLICMPFMIYQIWTENLNTALFLWIIFAIYFCRDFNSLSLFNIFSVLLFSIALISSHPMTAVFAPFLLFIGIKKHIKTKYVSLLPKASVLLSFAALIFAFFFNLYYIVNPIFNSAGEYIHSGIFRSGTVIRLAVSLILIFFISGAKNSSFKNKIFLAVFIASCINIFDNFIFNIHSSDSYIYRTVGFYSALLFMPLAVIFKNLKTHFIKTLNIVFMIVISLNSLYYARIWQRYLQNTAAYLNETRFENILYDSNLNIFTSQPVFFQVYHYHLHPFVLLLLPETFGVCADGKYKITVISQSQGLADFYASKITERKNILKNFSINTGENFKLYFKKGNDLIDF